MPLVIPGLAVGFLAFAAAFVLLGLSQTHTAQHGSSYIKSFFDTLLHHSALSALVGLAADASRALVSRFAGSQLKHLTGFFSALAFLTGETYKANANTAVATADAVQAVDHRRKVAVKQLAHRETRDTAKLHGEVRHAEAHARAVGHALNAYKAHANPRIAHATRAVDVTLPRSIGRIRTREEALSRDQAKLRERTGLLERGAEKTFEWIRAHPLSAVTGVFASAVAVALGRLGFGFLRCRSWQNVGRSLTCGMGRWLGDLLGLIATFALSGLSVLDPEVLARAAVATVDEIEPLLQDILK